MVDLNVTLERTLEVKWSRDDAFGLVADVPRSAAHFPGLRGLDDLGDGVYRWRLDSFRVGKFGFDVGYAARYVPDAEAGTVVWTTQPGGGNTRADGSWKVSELPGGGARLIFVNSIAVSVPLPRLMARLGRKALEEMSHRQVESYLRGIARTMEGRLLD